MSEEDKKPVRRSAPKIVVFESREKEPVSFDLCGYIARRNFADGRLEWHVPADDVDRFSSHFFCQQGRVVRKNVGTE